MDIFKELNPNQQEAVRHNECPLLIIAGSGSGKTRVIVHKIVYLITHKKVSPSNILAVTFTNKAAEEMKKRINKMLEKNISKYFWISTFHSACVRILRERGEANGIPKNFLIYDEKDQLSLIKECMKELNLQIKFSPISILGEILRAKDGLIDEAKYELDNNDYFGKTVAKVYSLYQEKLKNNRALDFSDLIFEVVNLFRNVPSILSYYQEKFRYILVDEYQDTNHSQYVFVKLLAEKYKNLTVVGDDDQSIYGWRGADISNILNFCKEYSPNVTLITLEENYRSTPNILERANKVIRHNNDRFKKTLFTRKEEGEPVIFKSFSTSEKESSFLANSIEELCNKKKFSYSDFVILYRMHAQSRVLEEKFIKEGIPYRIIGEVRFYERKEIKDIISYLKFIYNPLDEVSLRRIINSPPRGIGKTTLNKLEEFSRKNNIPISKILEIEEILENFSPKLKIFCEIIISLQKIKEEKNLTYLVKKTIEKSGYYSYLEKEDTEESLSRRENLEEFITVAKEFSRKNSSANLEKFLEHISLISNIDNYNENLNAVTMMTLHNAKGLEFPVVFIVGMEERIFPHRKSLYNKKEMEEERRLCYVGMTRAKESLYLTCASEREYLGSRMRNEISRFIKEAELLSDEDIREDIKKLPVGEKFFSEELKRLSLKYAPIKELE